MHYGEKYVVGSDFFGPAVMNESPVQWLIIGNKKKKEKAEISQVNRMHLVWPLLKWLVIGYETPQIWEFFLRPSLSDVVFKAGILLSRLRSAFKLLTGVRVARFQFSKDAAQSALVFESFFLQRVGEG